ncbi:hypothetical protein HPP92_022989 [Vanilla planifolia]|nr:hypothetical protein HPP92_022989 [Vanilla planifolia]
MLPAPQISDQELEEIAKMGYATDLALGGDELAEGSTATRALIADYSQTPRRGMTPLRTPQRTPSGKADAIMMEAENLARLRESQTPLLGGENPELHPSDFSGVTLKKREMQTPNPLATPLLSPGPMGLTPRIGMTPSRDGHAIGGTPKITPFRDDLHINEDVEMHESSKLELHRQEELKRNLRSGLTNLPLPKNEYQIVMQPIPEENEEIEDKIEEDMSDRIAREKALEQTRMEAILRKRSKVLQRDLPRPPAAALELIKSLLVRGNEDKSTFVPPTPFEQADEMINKELLSLLEHDNAKYPLQEKAVKEKVKGSKQSRNDSLSNHVSEYEEFEEDELLEADSLIKEEMEFLRVAMGHEKESFDDFVKARDSCQEDLMFFPARNTYGLASVAGSSEKLASLQNEFEIVKNSMDDEEKKAKKLERKIKVLTQGYEMRAVKLRSQILATFKQIETAATELECFQALRKQEYSAASYRINNLIEEVNKQKQLERTLQHRYGDLMVEEERIQLMLQKHKMHLQEEEIAARNRIVAEEVAIADVMVEGDAFQTNNGFEDVDGGENRTSDAINQSQKEETLADDYTSNDNQSGLEKPVHSPALNENSTENGQLQDLDAAKEAVENSVHEKSVEDKQTQEFVRMVDNIKSDVSFLQDGIPNPDPNLKDASEKPTDSVASSILSEESSISNTDDTQVEASAVAVTLKDAPYAFSELQEPSTMNANDVQSESAAADPVTLKEAVCEGEQNIPDTIAITDEL